VANERRRLVDVANVVGASSVALTGTGITIAMYAGTFTSGTHTSFYDPGTTARPSLSGRRQVREQEYWGAKDVRWFGVTIPDSDEPMSAMAA
jgi:hypothetical protein